MRVLLTGATGFIGSHIADSILSSGHEVIIMKRQKSSLQNCQSFIHRVPIIDIDTSNWISDICKMKPEVIVHTAWNGVASETRDDWESQLSNIQLTNELLYIAEYCNVNKFIAIGSQAEYGDYSGVVSEESPINPVTKYAYLKVAILAQIRSFCELRKIDWYWLRVFSVFGERESSNWLIPSVISRMLNGGKEMNFTPCEQKYAYLYVKDLAEAVLKVCVSNGCSGIYNVSSSHPIELRQLLSAIREKINPDFKLNFAVLPYREKQAMHMEGDSAKYIKQFGFFENHSFEEVINSVINYYRKLQ